jgi:hypothetical protein
MTVREINGRGGKEIGPNTERLGPSVPLKIGGISGRKEHTQQAKITYRGEDC